MLRRVRGLVFSLCINLFGCGWASKGPPIRDFRVGYMLVLELINCIEHKLLDG
jgi:hypothetical protein